MKNDAKLFALKWKDVAKGFVVAILTVVTTGLMTSFQSGMMPDIATVKPLLITGFGAGCAYLLKNFFSNSDGAMLTKEKPKEEVK